MFISFKVSNSRSIGNELELSAIATDDNLLPENTIDLPRYGIRILNTMALFGANASGKSNILKAIVDAKNIICKPDFDKKEIEFPFNRNKAGNAHKAINYSFTFLIEGTIYTYSFAHTRERILEERLIEYIDSSTENEIYSRVFDDSTGKYDWVSNTFFKDESTLHFRRSTAEHKLFLKMANSPANPDDISLDPLLRDVFQWFNTQLRYLIGLENPGKIAYRYFIDFVLQSNDNKKQILSMLKRIDISILDISILEVAKSDMTDGKFTTYQHRTSDGNEVAIIIKTQHKTLNDVGDGQLTDFDFLTEESHGTQQFLAWLGFWLYEFQSSPIAKIFVIDELGTSLHPKLTLLLMDLFANEETNPNKSQLIFTTHEVKLMDKSVMRPDQLYLINKNEDGNTSIERASDYDTEKYSRLDTLYMNGGMSGIPHISKV